MAYKVPAFSYPGGKAKLREQLVRMMPLCGHKYVEPFVGRGNIFWLAVHALDFEEWHLNDTWTARWFEAIRRIKISDIPSKMTEVLLRLYARHAVTNRAKDDLAVALESLSMFSGGVKGGISLGALQRPSTRSFKNTIRAARAIMRASSPLITDLDWRDCGLDGLSPLDFVYLDPPYEYASVKYHCNTVDHQQLLLYLLHAQHLWMISGYSSSLYTHYLGEPDAKLQSRVSMHHTVRGIFRTECVWTN